MSRGDVVTWTLLEVGKIKEVFYLRPAFSSYCTSFIPTVRLVVVSVAQLVARCTHDRKVVVLIPTNAVCLTVVR